MPKFKPGPENPRWKGVGDISGRWWDRHINRKERKISVNITIQQAWDLFVQQNKKCALSGVDIVIGKDRKSTTASLDRIDSKLGYTIDNVQWVHKDVNMMKQSYSQERFIELCKLIANNKG